MSGKSLLVCGNTGVSGIKQAMEKVTEIDSISTGRRMISLRIATGAFTPGTYQEASNETAKIRIRQSPLAQAASGTPVVTELRVIAVAGRDSMLLNLSGAHGPFFTRNLLILTDNAGRTGVGEVPGGEKIRQTLEDARAGRRPADRRPPAGAAAHAPAICRPRQRRPRPARSTCEPPSMP